MKIFMIFTFRTVDIALSAVRFYAPKVSVRIEISSFFFVGCMASSCPLN